ncbi:MAG: hypothetical protein PF486_03495 [Prolixibacteraceae bacterium]|jgi:hypothetical protein|nr:hypothetical protein [Prolixibacteraceae bacterium]
MKKLVFLFISIFILGSISAEAQILRNIARKAARQAKESVEDRASEEAEKEVDEQVNKAIDKILESDSTKSKKEEEVQNEPSSSKSSDRASAIMKAMGVETTDIPHKDMYKFNAEIISVTEVTNESGKKEQPVESKMLMNADNSDILFTMKSNKEDGVSIIDKENACALILAEKDGEKTGLALRVNPDNPEESVDEIPGMKMNHKETGVEDDCQPVKTSKTKTISGYKCNEYRCENDDEIQIAWITNEVDTDKRFNNMEWFNQYVSNELGGVIMSYENHSKTDQSSTVMTIKSIDWDKSSSFSTEGYEISSFSYNP